MIVYAVIFSNYEPSEVDSLWASKELAQARADELDGYWRVVPMSVGEQHIPGEKSE